MNSFRRRVWVVGAASTLALGLACSSEERSGEGQMHQQTTTVHEESEGSAVTGKRLRFNSEGEVTNGPAQTGIGGSGGEGTLGCEDVSGVCDDPADKPEPPRP